MANEYITNEEAKKKGQTLAAQKMLDRGVSVEQVKQLFPLAELPIEQTAPPIEQDPLKTGSSFDVVSSNTTAPARGFVSQDQPPAPETFGEVTPPKPISSSIFGQITGEQKQPVDADGASDLAPRGGVQPLPQETELIPDEDESIQPGVEEGPALPTRAEKEASLIGKEKRGLGFFFQALGGIADSIAAAANAGLGTQLKADHMRNIIKMQESLRVRLRKEVSAKVAKDPNIKEAKQLQDAMIAAQDLKEGSTEANAIRGLSLFDLASDPQKLIMAANVAKAAEARKFKHEKELARIKKVVKPGDLLTPAQKAVDVTFAKEYAEFVAGGKMEDAKKVVDQLSIAIDGLRKGGITGFIQGRIPDIVSSVTKPERINVRDLIEDVVQRNLRIILGAQFTEKEGERLIARAYNPKLSEEVNIERLERLQKQMKDALIEKGRASRYYEENGTLKGFKGNYIQEDGYSEGRFTDAYAQSIRKEGEGKFQGWKVIK